MKLIKKIFFYDILVVSLVLSLFSEAFADDKKPTSLAKAAGLKQPKVNSDSAVVLNAKSKAILYAKRADKKQYPASVTKVMTALLVLEHMSENADEKIICSKNAVLSIERGSSHIGMMPNEEISIKEALYAILLNSANEVSNALAEYVSGSLDDFAILMTKRAKELGCKHTHFVNANGLYDDEHYTTAYDMALILREAMTHPLFREIVMTRQSKVKKTNLTDEERYLGNSNKLIYKNGTYYYDKCTGGKTGYTVKAHHTLVNTASDGKLNLVSATLNSKLKPDKWHDTVKIFEFCFENFKDVSLLSDEGDKELKGLKAFNIDGKPLVGEESKLSYLDDEPTVSLPKDADFSDLRLDAAVVEDKGDNRTIRVQYFYNDFMAGECLVNEETKKEDLSNVGELPDNKNTKNIKKSKVLPIVISIVGISLIAVAVAFFIIRERKLKNDFYRFSIKKKKPLLDMSMFKKR